MHLRGVTYRTNITNRAIIGKLLLLTFLWPALNSCNVNGDANSLEEHQHVDSGCFSLNLVIDQIHEFTDEDICIETYYVEGFEFVVLCN